MEEKIDYENKYREICNQFWELQKIDKTDEELRYEVLSKQLKDLSRDYKERFNHIEDENEELQERVKDINKVRENYEMLLRRYNNLVELEKSFKQVHEMQ